MIASSLSWSPERRQSKRESPVNADEATSPSFENTYADLSMLTPGTSQAFSAVPQPPRMPTVFSGTNMWPLKPDAS